MTGAADEDECDQAIYGKGNDVAERFVILILQDKVNKKAA